MKGICALWFLLTLSMSFIRVLKSNHVSQMLWKEKGQGEINNGKVTDRENVNYSLSKLGFLQKKIINLSLLPVFLYDIYFVPKFLERCIGTISNFYYLQWRWYTIYVCIKILYSFQQHILLSMSKHLNHCHSHHIFLYVSQKMMKT